MHRGAADGLLRVRLGVGGEIADQIGSPCLLQVPHEDLGRGEHEEACEHGDPARGAEVEAERDGRERSYLRLVPGEELGGEQRDSDWELQQ